MSEIKSETHRSRRHTPTFTAPVCQGWNEAMMRQMLLLPGSLGLIAYQHDKPAGIVVYAYSPGQADIVTFGVLPDYRGLHVSDELMEASFRSLADEGIKEIFWKSPLITRMRSLYTSATDFNRSAAVRIIMCAAMLKRTLW